MPSLPSGQPRLPLARTRQAAGGSFAGRNMVSKARWLSHLGLGLLAAVGLSSCLFVPRETGERMQADLRALRGELTRLSEEQKALAEARERDQRAANEGLDSLRQSLATLDQQGRRADADIGSLLDQVQGDMMRLRGALEDSDHRLSETEARLQAELQTRLAVLKQTTARDEREATSAGAKLAAPRNKKELLGYARKLLVAGNRADARGVLRDVVRRFGKEAGLADEALLLLANLAREDGQQEAALRDYVRLIDGFGKSRHLAEAYFNVGECSVGLGRNQDAATFFAEVVATYPNSPFAAKAREGLRRLDTSKPSGNGRGPAAVAPAKTGSQKSREPNSVLPAPGPP